MLYTKFYESCFPKNKRSKDDLEDKIVKLIPESMLEEMRQWNSKGKDPWPWDASSVGDSSLMHFLSYKLESLSTELDRDVKITDIS